MVKKCSSKFFWPKICALALSAVITAILFYNSLGSDYQYAMAREHTRFRKEMPTQEDWLNSPFGKLKAYLFNVTNAEAFLNGTDARIKLQQIGPITYKLIGRNEVIARNASSLIYRKHRFRHVEFLPDDSVSPDILNQTIILPNVVLLSAAVQFSDWLPGVRSAFNVITSNEKVFLKNTVYKFLWEFTTPGLNMLSKFVPNIATNCGMLYNAFTEKDELYHVSIGPENGIENFFRIKSLNNKPIFGEQYARKRYLRADSGVQCPIVVEDTFDNSLFPPFVTPETEMRIVAVESCRTLPLTYQGNVEQNGLSTYRYTLAENSSSPSCLDSTYGIKLPKGMFDVSKCMINEAPTAFSNPHFLGTSYNWSEHFEGLNPNVEQHEPHILIEPITGIPMLERYRFQTNIPMPDLQGFNDDISKLQHMMIPTFFYDFEMNELPPMAMFAIRLMVKCMPILQPIIMTLLAVLSILSVLKIVLICNGLTLCGLIANLLSGTSNIKLQTSFSQNAPQDVEQLESGQKVYT